MTPPRQPEQCGVQYRHRRRRSACHPSRPIRYEYYCGHDRRIDCDKINPRLQFSDDAIERGAFLNREPVQALFVCPHHLRLRSWPRRRLHVDSRRVTSVGPPSARV